jgi:TRAP transporter TAXI family solute receptor
MLKKVFSCLALVALLAGTATSATAQTKEIRWGTSRTGSTGHKSLINLSALLNKHLKGYHVTVQPTPGAIISVKGYASEKFDASYGSDIAFYEYANNIERFKGFKEQAKRPPLQSMWVFTVEVGIGVKKGNKEIKQWRDLTGKRVFTGPRPWDTRAQIERALKTLGVKHEYVEVDLGAAGSLLEAGRLDAFGIYTNAESATAPWITEASLAADWAALNPSAEELAILKKAGFSVADVKPTMFKNDVGTKTMKLLPFYYGFHVGADIPTDVAYQILKIVEEHANELAKVDKGFAQVAADMVGMQKRGIASSVEFVQIHPGLAKYMKEKKAWNPAWDSHVAKLK